MMKATTTLAAGTTAGLLAAATALLAPLGAAGSTPGDNGDLLFSADLGQGSQIFTMGAHGRDLVQLTQGAGDASAPEWSADGQWIAYQFEVHRDTDIVVMRADGGHPHRLRQPGYQANPAFTPDGQHLLYECGGCAGEDGVFIMGRDGSGPRRLTTNPFPPEGDADPNISPDGRTVTFVRIQEQGKLQALFAVDVDGTNLRMLVDYDREVAIKHDWAPDGSRIAITTAADYPHHRSPNVATLAPDGSHLRFLTHFRGGQRGAFVGSYSPNGRWIVYRVENLETGLYVLKKMRPDGSHKTVIAKLPFRPRGTDWGAR
jgi:Tol biopolymer transport system component